MSSPTAQPHFQQKSSKILPVIILILLGLLYFNTVRWLVGSWIYNPYFSHGFIVLAVSAYFAYKVCKKTSFELEVDVRGLYVLAPSLIVHTLATVWDIVCISAVSLLTAVYGLILTLYGVRAAKQMTFPIFFMILAVPFPIYGLTNQLEVLSAQASVSLVSFFGIEASNVGAEIHLKTCSFVVGAPCSGIRSIISLLTVAVLYVYIVQDELWVKFVLVALATFLAFFANVLRISSILAIAELYGRDAALGYFHYASDLVLFVTAVVTLILLRRCLKWLISRPHS